MRNSEGGVCVFVLLNIYMGKVEENHYFCVLDKSYDT